MSVEALVSPAAPLEPLPSAAQDAPVLEPAQEASRPTKRRKPADADGDAQPQSVLVKKVATDQLRKQHPAMRCGAGYMEALNVAVMELIDASVSRAVANQRMTVRDYDL